MKSEVWKGKHGPLLIAEIGGNHEGNFDYAKKLTQLAIESDCDYVKFQIYTGDGLVNPLESPDRNEHFKKFELTKDQHLYLANMCKSAGIGYLASVWEEAALDWVNPYLDFYKIGSGDLTAYPILKTICRMKKPLLLSTGLATEQDVIDSVDYIRSYDAYYNEPDTIAILQCTSMYPIPEEDANLSVMSRLKELTKCPVGYSDHTEDNFALATAIAAGAQVLEFHFTDTKEGKQFRDHKVSLTKEDVTNLIATAKRIEKLKGNSLKRPLAIEGDHVVSFRRAIYPKDDIEEGTIISEEHIHTLRPNHGIPANQLRLILGKRALKNLKKNEKLDWKYFE